MNELSLYFEQPVKLALIRLLNYSKSPLRGVSDLEVLADDLLIYRGAIRKSRGAGSAAGEDEWQSILFTGQAETIARESRRVHTSSSEDHVLLVNDGKAIGFGNGSIAEQKVTQVPIERPGTAASHR